MAKGNLDYADPLVDEYHVLVGKLRVHQQSYLKDQSTDKMNPAKNPLVIENGKKKSRLTRSLGETGSPQSKRQGKKLNATFGNRSRTNSETSLLPPLHTYSRFSQVPNGTNKPTINHPDKRLDTLSKVPKPKEGITWYEICQQQLSPAASRKNYGQRDRERSKIILDIKQKWQDVSKDENDDKRHFMLTSNKTKSSPTNRKSQSLGKGTKYTDKDNSHKHSACKIHAENTKPVGGKTDQNSKSLEQDIPKTKNDELKRWQGISSTKHLVPQKERDIHEGLYRSDATPPDPNINGDQTVRKDRVKTAETWKTWRDVNDSYAYDNVEQYIKDNELMPEERAKRIKQWIGTVDTTPRTPDSQEGCSSSSSNYEFSKPERFL
ncbi:unnamed protein product [Owenia fusiformis]|uniref:Uncharacterized protein n=1 Tax=Owenia fusiformis TaxID=6347 RepID=A0A8S4N271_OWEFU|nr:unnamed protein product [Owenia fusiformis]